MMHEQRGRNWVKVKVFGGGEEEEQKNKEQRTKAKIRASIAESSYALSSTTDQRLFV